MRRKKQTALPRLSVVSCACGSAAWGIPGAPRSLPGKRLSPTSVLTVCLDCGATSSVANVTTRAA